MAVSKENSGFWYDVHCYLNERFPKTSMGDLLSMLDGHPIGLMRSVSAYYLEGQVLNNGFLGLFGNRFGCLACGAMEFYVRVGAEMRARVIRSAIDLCQTHEPDLAKTNNLRLSSFAGTVEPLSGKIDIEISLKKRSKFHQLDQLYYAEEVTLPGAGRFRRPIVGTIDWYAEHFPEDFPSDLIARRTASP